MRALSTSLSCSSPLRLRSRSTRLCTQSLQTQLFKNSTTQLSCRCTAGLRFKATGHAPGQLKVPAPNPPRQMVVEKSPTARGLRGFIRSLFDRNGTRNTAGKFADRQLPPLTLQEPKTEATFLHANDTTNLLYWYCTDLTFSQSDFERVGPPNVKFKTTRARNPTNLTRWMGYFLEFESKPAAVKYFEETVGHELCGFPLKFRFTLPTTQGFESPLLKKATGVPRKAHAIILGLPLGYPEHNVLRVLWDYDLLDDDTLAVERMPMGSVRYGGNPVLLRFKSEKEADRFVRDYDREVFPYTDAKIYCEVVD